MADGHAGPKVGVIVNAENLFPGGQKNIKIFENISIFLFMQKSRKQKEKFFFFTQISIYLKFYRSILFSIQQNRWIKENYLFRMRKLKDQGKID